VNEKSNLLYLSKFLILFHFWIFHSNWTWIDSLSRLDIDECENKTICEGTGFVNCTNFIGSFGKYYISSSFPRFFDSISTLYQFGFIKPDKIRHVNCCQYLLTFDNFVCVCVACTNCSVGWADLGYGCQRTHSERETRSWNES
jgi:hypothetical protein